MQKSPEQGKEFSGPVHRSEMAGQMAVLIFCLFHEELPN